MQSSPDIPSVCDFTRSFIRWRHDTTKRKMVTVSQPPPTTLNNVRIPLECVATIARHAERLEFGLGASCKTEQVFVEHDVWMAPNADMCAVSGAGQFLIIKRWDKADKGVMLYPATLGPQPERQCVDPSVAFETQTLTVRRRRAERLETTDAILAALGSDSEVVSRTTYSAGEFVVTIEYPVKTVNFSERHRYYQVDTGPVLFFDEAGEGSVVEHFHLAFIAHLGGNWAEFLVNRRTPLDPLPVSVHHFGETRRVTAENSLWLVLP